MHITPLSATEFRRRCFEILNLTMDGKEFIIEKDGRLAARLIPYTDHVPAKEVKKILANLRTVFSRVKQREYWSVLENPVWKKKEKVYLEKLPEKMT